MLLALLLLNCCFEVVLRDGGVAAALRDAVGPGSSSLQHRDSCEDNYSIHTACCASITITLTGQCQTRDAATAALQADNASRQAWCTANAGMQRKSVKAHPYAMPCHANWPASCAAMLDQQLRKNPMLQAHRELQICGALTHRASGTSMGTAAACMLAGAVAWTLR